MAILEPTIRSTDCWLYPGTNSRGLVNELVDVLIGGMVLVVSSGGNRRYSRRINQWYRRAASLWLVVGLVGEIVGDLVRGLVGILVGGIVGGLDMGLAPRRVWG
jgi:hypothetical protein